MATHESNSPDLNLEQAEIDEPAGPLSCTVCNEQLVGSYFDINGSTTCARCRRQLEEGLTAGTPAGRFGMALVAGVIAGAVGAGIWFAVQELTGYQVGLVAIVVGWLVGRAVRWGARARGGWVYQGMAVSLTYVAIVATAIPQIIEEMRTMDLDEPPVAEAEAETGAEAEETAPVAENTAAENTAAENTAAEDPATEPAAHDTAAAEGATAVEDATATADAPELDLPRPVVVALAVVFLLGVAMVAPFFSGIIGLIIIGIGLHEAWRQNKKLVLTIEGPFELGQHLPDSTAGAVGAGAVGAGAVGAGAGVTADGQ